jgi:predicted secreted protein
MSKAYSAKGTVLSFGTAVVGTGTQTYTFTPAEIKTINLGGMKTDFEDTTNLGSTGAFRERLPTLNDGGDVTISGNRIAGDAGQAELSTALVAQTLCAFKIQLPESTTQTTAGDSFTFLGYVAEAGGVDIQFDKALSFSCKITITGPITFTAGS